MPSISYPDLVIAADWGVGSGKRWMARAIRRQDGYSLSHPVPVGEPGTLIERVRKLAGGGSALVGFDFPIGLPAEYAGACYAGQDFRTILKSLSEPFFTPSDTPTVQNPFGPRSSTKGIFSSRDLAQALGLGDGLLRSCDRGASANPMFYTLGPRQVGRAATHGWKEVLQPNLETIRLWPFDGPLADLLQPGAVVVAEIYPGWFYRKLKDPAANEKGGKEAVSTRRFRWNSFLQKVSAAGINLELTESAVEWAEAGFASSDDFDAMVSVLGMLLAQASPEAPELSDPAVRLVEGWMLGVGPKPESVL